RQYFPGAIVRRNVIIGGDAGKYPPDNFFPRSADDAGLEPTADLEKLAQRRYGREGTDGRDIGADIGAIVNLVKAVPSGRPDGQADGTRAMSTTLASLVAVSAIPATAVFWASLLLLAYVYLGYALVVRVRALLFP